MQDTGVTWKIQRDQALDPADPLPEDTNGDFLTDIRSTWLTTATPAQPKSGLDRFRRRKPPRPRLRPLVEVDPQSPVKAGIASIDRTLASAVQHLSGSLRVRTNALLSLAIVAAVLVFGALAYTVAIDFILDPATVPDVAQAETSQAPPAQSPIDLLLPAGNGGSAGTAASPSPDTPGVLEIPGTIATGDSPISGFEPSMDHVLNGAEVAGQNGPRAGAGDASAVTLAQAADIMAQRVRDPQALEAQAPAPPPSPAVRTPAIAADAGAADIQRVRSRSEDSADESPSLDLVRAGQRALESNDIQGAYKLAVQAKELNPGSLSALELMQVLLAASGDPDDAQAAALESIAHGGNAVFELQRLDAQSASVSPARIVVTAATLQFVPESAHDTGAFSVPLASITSVQMGRDVAGSDLLAIHFNNSRNVAAQLSFTDASYRPESSATGRSQFSPSRQVALLAAIRNVILTAKSRSQPVAGVSALR